MFPQGYDFRKQEKKEVPVDDSKLVGRQETLGRYKGVELYVISQKYLDEIKIWWMLLVISKIWAL